MPTRFLKNDRAYLLEAFRLAEKGFGRTSPNPMVGAVLVKNGRVIGRGWHHRAGHAHAEIEALAAATENPKGATLFVTLEPCSTQSRTPACTIAIIRAGIKRVVVAGLDVNPAHRGHGLEILRKAGIAVNCGELAERAARLNESFNHWIVHRTPRVTVKAAMTLDGKIATITGESKWITGGRSRARAMKLRAAADAVLVGVNTVLKDDPSLTPRYPGFANKPLRRIVLDPKGRTPLAAKVLSDDRVSLTTVVVADGAPAALRERVNVLEAPARNGQIDLLWLLKKLGREDVCDLLVEGGGETNATFLLPGLAQRIAFFYAPIVVGGRSAPKAVGGIGLPDLRHRLALDEVKWERLGRDLLLTARVARAH